MNDVTPVSGNPQPKTRKKGAPIKRTPKQQAAVEKAAEARQQNRDLAVQRNQAEANAAQLAQVVNLVIAGHSFESIGASIGASASDIEQMVSQGAERYVRTQPALRTWVRNWISAKYTAMIDADWDQASDPDHPEKLEHQDRVMRMLPNMARLHGAEAPTQSEVKVEHSHDAVENLVRKLSEQQGTGLRREHLR
jgi:transposase